MLSDYLTKNNVLRTKPILRVKTENPTVKTFTFHDDLCAKAKPGQFLMLWIPQIDEIPLSIKESENKTISVTVKAVGDATKKLNNLIEGSIIGIRGPFGTGFSTDFNKVLIIGGGTGMIPLFFLTKKIINKIKKLTFINGAKTKNELLYFDSLQNLLKKQEFIATTEDGSYGFKGFVIEPFEKLIKKKEYDVIYACGPEKMIRRVYEIAEKHKIYMEASLERIMRCGIGLCGSCVIGKYRVCRDGPVFNSSQLYEIKNEFGLSKLDKYGKTIPL